MRKLTNILIFLAGVAAGATGAWYFLKERYENLAEEEIESVKTAYAAREQVLTSEVKEAREYLAVKHQPLEKPDLKGYVKKLQEEGYVDYSRTVAPGRPVTREEEPLPVSPTPYVISPEEFGEMDGYTQISLTCFADGVVADEDDEPLENAEEIIGDALDHFGEYEDDSVFVRNDAKRCDYEILKDNRRFHEARRNRPPVRSVPVEDNEPEDEDEED